MKKVPYRSLRGAARRATTHFERLYWLNGFNLWDNIEREKERAHKKVQVSSFLEVCAWWSVKNSFVKQNARFTCSKAWTCLNASLNTWAAAFFVVSDCCILIIWASVYRPHPFKKFIIALSRLISRTFDWLSWTNWMNFFSFSVLTMCWNP